MSTIQTMPHNSGLEAAVLGALIFNNNLIHMAAGTLSEFSFYAEQHITIWNAISTLHGNGKTADDVTLIEYFEREEQLKKIGGEEYLAKIVMKCALEPELEEFMQMLLELQNRRRLTELGQKIKSLALTPKLTDNAANIATDAQKDLSEIITGSASVREPTAVTSGISTIVQKAREHKENPKPTCLSTGMNFLDTRLGGGLFAPDLIILAARPSMGKTSLATQIAINVSRGPSLKNPERTRERAFF